MLEVPVKIPLAEFNGWMACHGLSITVPHTSFDMAWAVASWKEHQFNQERCEFNRVIDGLRCEVKDLTAQIADLTAQLSTGLPQE